MKHLHFYTNIWSFDKSVLSCRCGDTKSAEKRNKFIYRHALLIWGTAIAIGMVAQWFWQWPWGSLIFICLFWGVGMWLVMVEHAL